VSSPQKQTVVQNKIHPTTICRIPVTISHVGRGGCPLSPQNGLERDIAKLDIPKAQNIIMDDT
jgi:hypothetical protein